MSDEKNTNEFEEYSAGVLKAENKFYQEVTITQVDGVCPYGHREGETFRVTAMNSDGICGSLLKAIFSEIITLHYGGSILWEKTPDVSRGCCPEKGKVHVEVKRVSQQEPVLFKTPFQYKNMTGKGFAALDTYRLLVEVRDIAVTCIWGHKIGDVFEVDPFNVGGACCFLYVQFYPYLHVLLSGATPAWSFEEHSMGGECPDTYDRLCYRLFLEKRK